MTLRVAEKMRKREKNVYAFLHPMMIMYEVVIGNDTVLVSFDDDDYVEDDMDAIVSVRWPVSDLCSDDGVLLTHACRTLFIDLILLVGQTVILGVRS